VEEAHAEAVVEEDAVVAEVNRKIKAMKKIIIHSIPVVISLIWLVFTHHTFNPISLKGPSFLFFYLLLIIGFYASIFILKLIKQKISEVTFYFMISIFILGIIKLVKGMFLGKPVGFLIMILVVELIVILFIHLSTLSYKINKVD